LLADEMSDEEFVQQIKSGKIYTGKLVAEAMVATVKRTKEVSLQKDTYLIIQNIRKVLIALLLHAIEWVSSSR